MLLAGCVFVCSQCFHQMLGRGGRLLRGGCGHVCMAMRTTRISQVYVASGSNYHARSGAEEVNLIHMMYVCIPLGITVSYESYCG
jgi:hypothetical protein